jgi:hypothetical protein
LGSTDAPVTPKPVDLLKRVFWIGSEPGDIVLDSFAGTGTSAQAVLEMNAEGKGERQFVIVQQAHDTKDDSKESRNLCNSLTAERVRRVITGYGYKKRGSRGKVTTAKQSGLGGSFSYVRVGPPLFGEYRDFGERPPDFEDLARYIFYTETSRESDPKKFDRESGFIGETDAAGGTSYYLLYDPAPDVDRELSLVTLAQLRKSDKNRNWVVYCEKFWMHDDQLRKFEREHGKRIRPMIVPFQLK